MVAVAVMAMAVALLPGPTRADGTHIFLLSV
jgi:hypothetical protein